MLLWQNKVRENSSDSSMMYKALVQIFRFYTQRVPGQVNIDFFASCQAINPISHSGFLSSHFPRVCVLQSRFANGKKDRRREKRTLYKSFSPHT